MRRTKPAWVYFVRRLDGEGPVKIGVSQHPANRLASLMTWAPYPMAVVASMPGDEELERRFHLKFWSQHSHREWFHPSPELAAVIAAVADGVFDTSTLPTGSLPRSVKRSPEAYAAASVSLRLTHMGYWGYPIPAHITAASRDYWRLGPDEIQARRAIVAAWVEEHHPVASKWHAAQRKLAA